MFHGATCSLEDQKGWFGAGHDESVSLCRRVGRSEPQERGTGAREVAAPRAARAKWGPSWTGGSRRDETESLKRAISHISGSLMFARSIAHLSLLLFPPLTAPSTHKHPSTAVQGHVTMATNTTASLASQLEALAAQLNAAAKGLRDGSGLLDDFGRRREITDAAQAVVAALQQGMDEIMSNMISEYRLFCVRRQISLHLLAVSRFNTRFANLRRRSLSRRRRHASLHRVEGLRTHPDDRQHYLRGSGRQGRRRYIADK